MNVLKNFVNKTYLKTAPLLLISPLLLFSKGAFSVSEPVKNQTVSTSTPEGLLSMILALLFVVLVIFAIAWIAKRFNLAPSNSGQIKMVSATSLGGRERIIVIEIEGEQHAIGVTNHSVNHLFKLEHPIESTKSALTENHLIHKINRLFGYKAPNMNKDTISKSKD